MKFKINHIIEIFTCTLDNRIINLISMHVRTENMTITIIKYYVYIIIKGRALLLLIMFILLRVGNYYY